MKLTENYMILVMTQEVKPVIYMTTLIDRASYYVNHKKEVKECLPLRGRAIL